MGNTPLQPCCVMRDHEENMLEKMPRFPPCSAPVSPRGKARSKSVSTPTEGHDCHDLNIKRCSKTRSPKGRRLEGAPEGSRSNPLPSERSRRVRQERSRVAVEKQKKAGSPRTELLKEAQPQTTLSPLEGKEAVLTHAQTLKAAEVRLNKEHKEKRKKRKEAGKGDFSDRTSDGGSARCPTLGAQVANCCPAELELKAQQGGAALAPDGTDTVTTETCGSATSEGLLSCNEAYGIAWEPAAEEPCGSDGTETLTEQAWLCPLDEKEQSKDGHEELPAVTTPDKGCLPSEAAAPPPSAPQPQPTEAPLPLPIGDAEERVSENGSMPVDLTPKAAPIMFDLAADDEVPALAAEFTAQLSEVDLGHFAEPLARLGVEAACDVAYISDKELGRIGMRLVQRRKLRAMAPSGQDEDSEETKVPYVDPASDADSSCFSEVSTADAISNEADINTIEAPTKLKVVSAD